MPRKNSFVTVRPPDQGTSNPDAIYRVKKTGSHPTVEDIETGTQWRGPAEVFIPAPGVVEIGR